MERAFQTALWLLRPHIVFILGDIFDEGKWSSQKVNRPSVSNDDSYTGGKASALLLFIIIIIIIIIPNRPERLQNTITTITKNRSSCSLSVLHLCIHHFSISDKGNAAQLCLEFKLRSRRLKIIKNNKSSTVSSFLSSSPSFQIPLVSSS